jgi:hypothetical protein
MGEIRGACRSLVGKPEGYNQFEDLGLDERIILKWALKYQLGRIGLD